MGLVGFHQLSISVFTTILLLFAGLTRIELLWALLEREIELTKDAETIRSLWNQSHINLEYTRMKKSVSKMIIKVEEEFEGQAFILEVWRLLKKVCLRKKKETH